MIVVNNICQKPKEEIMQKNMQERKQRCCGRPVQEPCEDGKKKHGHGMGSGQGHHHKHEHGKGHGKGECCGRGHGHGKKSGHHGHGKCKNQAQRG